MTDTFVVDDKGQPADLPAPETDERPVKDDAPAPEPEAEEVEEAAASDDEAAEPESEDEERPKPKNRVSARKRIGQLTAELRGVQRELAQVKSGQKPAQADAMPKQDQFETYEEYIDARAAYVAKQTFAAEARKSQEAQQAARQEEMVERFRQRSEGAADRYDDYDDVIAASEVPISNAMGHAIIESDAGPDISYYLAKHPAEARRIAALSPIGQVREIGKLEAKIAAPPKPKKTTAAPTPPKTLRPEAKAVVNPDDMPMAQWVEHERKRMKAKGLL